MCSLLLNKPIEHSIINVPGELKCYLCSSLLNKPIELTTCQSMHVLNAAVRAYQKPNVALIMWLIFALSNLQKQSNPVLHNSKSKHKYQTCDKKALARTPTLTQASLVTQSHRIRSVLKHYNYRQEDRYNHYNEYNMHNHVYYYVLVQNSSHTNASLVSWSTFWAGKFSNCAASFL